MSLKLLSPDSIIEGEATTRDTAYERNTMRHIANFGSQKFSRARKIRQKT